MADATLNAAIMAKKGPERIMFHSIVDLLAHARYVGWNNSVSVGSTAIVVPKTCDTRQWIDFLFDEEIGCLPGLAHPTLRGNEDFDDAFFLLEADIHDILMFLCKTFDARDIGRRLGRWMATQRDDFVDADDVDNSIGTFVQEGLSLEFVTAFTTTVLASAKLVRDMKTEVDGPGILVSTFKVPHPVHFPVVFIPRMALSDLLNSGCGPPKRSDADPVDTFFQLLGHAAIDDPTLLVTMSSMCDVAKEGGDEVEEEGGGGGGGREKGAAKHADRPSKRSSAQLAGGVAKRSGSARAEGGGGGVGGGGGGGGAAAAAATGKATAATGKATAATTATGEAAVTAVGKATGSKKFDPKSTTDLLDVIGKAVDLHGHSMYDEEQDAEDVVTATDIFFFMNGLDRNQSLSLSAMLFEDAFGIASPTGAPTNLTPKMMMSSKVAERVMCGALYALKRATADKDMSSFRPFEMADDQVFQPKSVYGNTAMCKKITFTWQKDAHCYPARYVEPELYIAELQKTSRGFHFTVCYASED